MKPYLKFTIIFLTIIAVLWAAYVIAFPTFDVRYRLTLDLDIDGKPVQSSGVVETNYEVGTDRLFGIFNVGIVGGSFQGNAVTIDLGEKGLIFVVNYPAISPLSCYRPSACSGPLHPAHTDLNRLPFDMFGLPAFSRPSRVRELVRPLLAHLESVEVPLGKLPMLVRFRDINDSSTNEQVDPEHLELTYGPKVKLLRATLQLTHDSKGPLPAKWPRWLIDGHGGGISGTGQQISLGTYPFKGN